MTETTEPTETQPTPPPMTQQFFFVAKGKKIHGPQTDKRVETTRDGRQKAVCQPGTIYGSHDAKGNPVPLPSGLVDYAQNKIESNGQSCMQNWIESGYVVLTPGAESPVEFAQALPVNMIAKNGMIREDKTKR